MTAEEKRERQTLITSIADAEDPTSVSPRWEAIHNELTDQPTAVLRALWKSKLDADARKFAKTYNTLPGPRAEQIPIKDSNQRSR